MNNPEVRPTPRRDKNGTLYHPKTNRRKLAPGEERGLTERQTEVLKLRATGKSYKEIAATLFLSEKTVSSHLVRIKEIVGATSPIKLLVYALKHRILLEVEWGNPDGGTS